MPATNGSGERGKIMLSYCWADKKMVNMIRYRLWKEGFRVWIDDCRQDGMEDNIYSDMANAVKEATIVIGCLSLDYEKSVNCKREGSCIGDYDKGVIPLLLMKKYKLNDWVQGIYGGKLYIDFSEPSHFETKFEELLNRLKKYQLQLNPQKDNPTPSFLPEPEPPAAGFNPDPPTTASDETDAPSLSDNKATALVSALSLNETPLNSQVASLGPQGTTGWSFPKQTPAQFRQLLMFISKRWEKFYSISLLKVMMCEYRIAIADLQKTGDVFKLLKLLQGSGKISETNIDVLVRIALLCEFDMATAIRKKIQDYPDLNELGLDEKSKISGHRKNLFEFGRVLSEEHKEIIIEMCELNAKQIGDNWDVIFALEIKGTLTPQNKDSFIDILKENDMQIEIDALNKHT